MFQIYWEAILEINEVKLQDFDTTFTYTATNDYGTVSYKIKISAPNLASDMGTQFNSITNCC
jgi:hypothetical protein